MIEFFSKKGKVFLQTADKRFFIDSPYFSSVFSAPRLYFHRSSFMQSTGQRVPIFAFGRVEGLLKDEASDDALPF